jgi:1,4-alpha-glucan branching enzyme
MGEEWGCERPFPFFAHFGPDLAARVREGRRREFARFPEFRDEAARERIPDPGARETFRSGRLRWDDLESDRHRAWLAYYRRLLGIRHREIVPRLAGITERAAGFTEIGESGLQVSWRLSAGGCLRLWAQLGPERCTGAPVPRNGTLLFSTHEALPQLLQRGEMPPWSAAWYLEKGPRVEVG